MKQTIKRIYLNAWQGLYRVLPNYNVNRQAVKNVTEIKSNTDHIFRGYYDINYFDKNLEKFLIHLLPKSEEDGNCIGIGYYDLQRKQIVKITESSAWCWQQGSRLRWLDSHCIIFNDCIDGHYISRVVDLYTRETIKQYSFPIYDIAINREYGLSLNFSRLQRLRPGYGYKTINDNTVGLIASQDDGIFYVDLHDNTNRLIISLSYLHELINPELDGEDYINHICISPKEDSFIFFYIVTDKERKKSKVYLCWADNGGNNIKVLEENVQTSHYTWLDNSHLLTTYLIPEQKMRQGYRIYNLENEEQNEFGEDILTLDGHPTFIGNYNIVTDTYPQTKKGNIQYLLLYNNKDHKKTNIGRFFHDIHYSDEKRCDLHPSYFHHSISIDSSCFGLRSVLILNLKN